MEKKAIATTEDTENLLKTLGIPFYTIHHPPVNNVEEMLANCKSDKGPLTYCKNLFLYEKKKDDNYLVIALHDTVIDLKNKEHLAKIGNKNLRFCDEATMMALVGCKKGAVTPFSLYNDKANKVTLVVDKKLWEGKSVTFHPMQNDALIEISTEDFKKFITSIGKVAKVVDFAAGKSAEPEAAAPKEEKKKKEGGEKGKKPPAKKKDEEDKSDTVIGIEFKKAENWPLWYQQVLKKSEMIEYCQDISGCYVLRPWSYAIWEKVQQALDAHFKSFGVENSYFPMFVSKAALEKEQSHLEGFKAEVAWVTKSGDTDLEQPIAIRPTSETIMYPYFQKWIRSHRDLPLKINQWSNIVRWEFKDPTPFIRTREFLWQEGHTAHATKEEAAKMVSDMLEVYHKVYEEILAIPTIKGVKSEEEKFPGAIYTTSVETLIPANGRGIQAATSHHLGQNFSKMFEIYFLNELSQNELVWQTSWGFTTRSVGIMVLMHGDDKGLVLPPRVAPIQVVMVPIFYDNDQKAKFLQKLDEIAKEFAALGIRFKIDDRMIYTPGWKFNHWELKGVPIRIELGIKDYDKSEVRIVRRDNGSKEQLKWAGIGKNVQALLEEIQASMLAKAKAAVNDTIVSASTWADFLANINNRKACLTPWCKENDCETKVKTETKKESQKLAEKDPTVLTGSVKTLNLPFEAKPIEAGEKCFFCGKPAQCRALWGRSY